MLIIFGHELDGIIHPLILRYTRILNKILWFLYASKNKTLYVEEVSVRSSLGNTVLIVNTAMVTQDCRKHFYSGLANSL